MNKKLAIVLGVAFVAASAATVFFYLLVSRQLSAPGPPSRTAQIVVAARDLPRGVEVQAEDLKLASWGAAALPEGVFTGPEQAAGRRVDEAVAEGEPLLAANVARPGESGWAARIPEGMRAVSVHVNEYAGVTRLLEAGDRVDVLAAGAPFSTRGKDVKLRTLLQNVEVLATGREGLDEGRPNTAPVVTLLVAASDSEALSLADHSGTIRLALRNPQDESTHPPSSRALTDLFEPEPAADERQQQAGSGTAPERVSERSERPGADGESPEPEEADAGRAEKAAAEASEEDAGVASFTESN